MEKWSWAALASVLVLSACASTGTLSIAGRTSVNAEQFLHGDGNLQMLGPAQGSARRGFILGIFPYGDSAFSTALDDALKSSKGDALINVTTTTDLKGYIPLYNFFASTCTKVQGTAVKFSKQG